jgi:broad specificity phosphatase PhoE
VASLASVTHLILARHGETDWNAERRFQGHADPPLNDTGRAQAEALAERLAAQDLAAIYSSDLRRAAQTAAAVGNRFGLPVVELPSLREIDVGEWSGLTVSEVVERYPDGYARHRAGGDGWTAGETHAQLTERIVRAVSEIANEHPRRTVLVVAHGAALRALLAYAEGIDLSEFRRDSSPIENGSLAAIVVEDGCVRRLD